MDALKEESEIIYDFCMCNPPFFANQLEAQVKLFKVIGHLVILPHLQRYEQRQFFFRVGIIQNAVWFEIFMNSVQMDFIVYKANLCS